MKKPRKSRPLLRIAALTAGSLLVGCGSAQGEDPADPVPLPGNPKGTVYEAQALMTLKISFDHSQVKKGTPLIILGLAPSLPYDPLFSKTVPVGDASPMVVKITDQDVASGKRGQPMPANLTITVRADNDQDGKPETSKPDDHLGAATGVTADGRDVVVSLMNPALRPELPKRPIRGNPKGSMYDKRMYEVPDGVTDPAKKDP